MAYRPPAAPGAYYGQHMVDAVSSNSFYRQPRPNEYESENGPVQQAPSSRYDPSSFYNVATQPYQAAQSNYSSSESWSNEEMPPPIPPRPLSDHYNHQYDPRQPNAAPPPIPDKPQDLFDTLMAQKRAYQQTGKPSPYLEPSTSTASARDSLASGIYDLYGASSSSVALSQQQQHSDGPVASTSKAPYPSSYSTPSPVRPVYPIRTSSARTPLSMTPSLYASHTAPLVAARSRTSSREHAKSSLGRSASGRSGGHAADRDHSPPPVPPLPNPSSSVQYDSPTILTTPPIVSSPLSENAFADQLARGQSQSSSFSTHLHPSSSLSRGAQLPTTTLSRDSSFQVDAFANPEFVNPGLLSNIAQWARDSVQKGVRMNGPVECPDAFTGAEMTTAILNVLPDNFKNDRRYARSIAQSLFRGLWFHEVDWRDAQLKDDDSQVFTFDSSSIERYDQELPTSVLTPLTRCYSPFCGQFKEDGSKYACYSISCPDRPPSVSLLQRQPSSMSAHSGLDSAGRFPAARSFTLTSELQTEAPENWESSVPRAVIQSLDKAEIARQSLIFELIQGEEHYQSDLVIVEDHFVDPLRAASPPIISPQRIDDFIDSILLNMRDITHYSRAFLDALRDRQQQGSSVVSGIGDIVLASALDWSRAYVSFMVHFPLADSLLKEEKSRNPHFDQFVSSEFNKRHPPATKKGFDTFHSRPAFRLLRYVLLLEQILKNTPRDLSHERDCLEQAIHVIKRQSADANEGIVKSKSMVACREWHRDLVKKPTDGLDLDLLNANRTHFMSGKAWRKGEGSGFSEWVEVHLILFDHYLVVTKPPRMEKDGKKYSLARRAVPLDFIQLRPNSFTDSGVVKSSGFTLRPVRFNSNDHPSDGPHGSSASPITSSNSNDPIVYPISFLQVGRFNGIVTYFVDTESQRAEWSRQFSNALEAHAAMQVRSTVVRMDVLSDQTFGAETLGSLAPSAPASAQFGRPTCSVPTVVRGTELVLAGCAEGVFIGFRGKPRSMKSLIQLKGITQCAVLEEFGYILVLANGILIAYSLEALIPSSASSTSAANNGAPRVTSKAPQRLSGQKEVLFFKCGKIESSGSGATTHSRSSAGSGLSSGHGSRTLVIYVKKGGVKESIFKALEPITYGGGAAAIEHDYHHQHQANGHHGGGGGRFLGLGGHSKHEWFRTYKDFFLPTPVSTVQFMKSKLAIVCAKGIEIMSLDTLRTMSVPDFSSPATLPHSPPPILLQQQQHGHVHHGGVQQYTSSGAASIATATFGRNQDDVLSSIARRCEDSKAMGMFRLADNLFLLVYDDFAIHVDKHGEPFAGGNSGLMEWDSIPESVAFIHPHIFGFSSNIIEIRHAMTGQLVQVIQGSQITLTYDGVNMQSSLPAARQSMSSSSVASSSWSDAHDPSRRTSNDSISNASNRVLHFSMRVGSFHVLYEMSSLVSITSSSSSMRSSSRRGHGGGR